MAPWHVANHLQDLTQALQPGGLASQLHPGLKSLPTPWLKAQPQLFNISMKLVKSYRYVKWPRLRLVAKLLLCRIALNGPAPCVPSPSSDLWGWGHPIYIFSISWTPWVLDPITNPYLGAPLVAPCYMQTAALLLSSYVTEKKSSSVFLFFKGTNPFGSGLHLYDLIDP